jgi:methyl coenzyme M reductase gamma subunit
MRGKRNIGFFRKAGGSYVSVRPQTHQSELNEYSSKDVGESLEQTALREAYEEVRAIQFLSSDFLGGINN